MQLELINFNVTFKHEKKSPALPWAFYQNVVSVCSVKNSTRKHFKKIYRYTFFCGVCLNDSREVTLIDKFVIFKELFLLFVHGVFRVIFSRHSIHMTLTWPITSFTVFPFECVEKSKSKTSHLQNVRLDKHKKP